MSLAEELTRIYLEKENWHANKLSEEESLRYFQRLIDKGAIITCVDANRLLGYVETWCINFEQFGRIICGEQFSAFHEDVEHGNIAYLANVFIQETHRHNWVARCLKFEFLRKYGACEFFVGEARRKSCAPLKVFRRKDIAKLMEV